MSDRTLDDVGCVAEEGTSTRNEREGVMRRRRPQTCARRHGGRRGCCRHRDVGPGRASTRKPIPVPSCPSQLGNPSNFQASLGIRCDLQAPACPRLYCLVKRQTMTRNRGRTRRRTARVQSAPDCARKRADLPATILCHSIHSMAFDCLFLSVSRKGSLRCFDSGSLPTESCHTLRLVSYLVQFHHVLF